MGHDTLIMSIHSQFMLRGWIFDTKYILIQYCDMAGNYNSHEFLVSVDRFV